MRTSIAAFAAFLLIGCDGLPNPDPGQPTGRPTAPDGNPVSAPCPSAEESFDAMLRSSYAVVVAYKRGSAASDVTYAAIGTAFAVGPKKLATNGHIGDAILDNPFPVEQVVAVQAGTGELFPLSRVAIHPAYDGDPLSSPDVSILVTLREVPEYLTLPSAMEFPELAIGSDLTLTGFPGDVNELFDLVPGTTVPQATALAGSITALRSFDPTVVVDIETTDIIQHQIPTTPGTSGSPLVLCGEVVAVHNAGTVKVVVTLDEAGMPVLDRQVAAANNFGIHVKYLRVPRFMGLMSRDKSGSLASG